MMAWRQRRERQNQKERERERARMKSGFQKEYDIDSNWKHRAFTKRHVGL